MRWGRSLLSATIGRARPNPLFDQRPRSFPVPMTNARIGWRWPVWHRFSHKNRTQLIWEMASCD